VQSQMAQESRDLSTQHTTRCSSSLIAVFTCRLTGRGLYLSQIAKETKDLATRARANKLLPEEFTGALRSFTGELDFENFKPGTGYIKKGAPCLPAMDAGHEDGLAGCRACEREGGGEGGRMPVDAGHEDGLGLGVPRPIY
jgi:hypothetical protein